jgi:hypothetical protein
MTIDPIHAAIAAYRQSREAHENACQRHSNYGEHNRDPNGRLPGDDTADMLYERCDKAGDARHLALRTMLSTEPTTPAGAAALVEYVRDNDVDDLIMSERDNYFVLLDTLATALRQMT